MNLIRHWHQLLGVIACTAGAGAIAVENPVAPIADAGLFRHRGRYYVVGVRTNGRGYWSEDLVRWHDAAGQELACSPGMRTDWQGGFPMWPRDDHVYAHCHMNGRHHLYSNGIHHGVADAVTGPYAVTSDFAPGIDPFVFRDDDGRFFFYSMVHVRPGPDELHWGNNIWVQSMSGPGSLTGKPKRLLHASEELLWERRDHRIAEGPFVLKYRDLYYLLYNTNHTQHLLGNYAIGVATARTPTGFSQSSKYKDPVLKDNLHDVRAAYRAIVDSAEPGPGTPGTVWAYTGEKAPAGWDQPGFDDTGWRRGPAGIGDVQSFLDEARGAFRRSRVFPQRTKWTGPHLWLRHEFSLNAPPDRPLALLLRHIGNTEVRINGSRVYQSRGWLRKPTFVRIESAGLRAGTNCLAVRCSRQKAPVFCDVGLYEMLTSDLVPYIYNAGQPNVVRGPNGFEWWLVYFGIWNGSRHALGLDRVHFHDRRLVVDGPTGVGTPGYHPRPRPPQFADTFGAADAGWITNGRTTVADGVMRVRGPDPGQALVPAAPATCGLYECDVRVRGAAGAAGIVLAGGDGATTVRIALEPATAHCLVTVTRGRNDEERRYPVPRPFVFDAFHHLRVEWNAGTLRLWLDGVSLTPTPTRILDAVRLRPGHYAAGTDADFDGALYTIGWDEYGRWIEGWLTPGRGMSCSATDEGLSLHSPRELGTFVKGDPMRSYEFSAHVYPAADAAAACGAVPVYVDEATQLRVLFDTGEAVITSLRDGEKPVEKRVPLKVTEAGHTVRATKLADRTIIVVDRGAPVTVPGAWPASRVALLAQGASSRVDSISCFAIP